MEVVAILQARMNSTRLPGKVMRRICGKPMLELQIERVLQSQYIDELVVATSTNVADKDIVSLCQKLGIRHYCGSLDNVLERFFNAASKTSYQHVVRLTGDCPLIDPKVIDGVIAHHIERGADYTSNTLEPTFPDGLDVEVMTKGTLEAIYQKATTNSQKEHVTLYVHEHAKEFQLESYINHRDLSGLRWTVDEPEDLQLVTWLFEQLYARNPQFSMADILSLLESNLDKQVINNQFDRNEGLQLSLERDQHSSVG